MSSGHTQWIQRFRMVLPICLLLALCTGQALATSGSTQLTIHLDQSVIDAIARWKGEAIRPGGNTAVPASDGVLQRLLPVVRAGLDKTLHPQSALRILLQLRLDTLVIYEGRAEQAGSAGGHCLTAPATGGLLTVHSI